MQIPCPTLTFIACPKCRRKLFKVKFFDLKANIEIKCQKCKNIVEINIDNGDITLKTKFNN